MPAVSFPSPSRPTAVDPRAPRFAASLTTVVLAAALLTGSTWLLLIQAVAFALGAANISPYALAFRPLVRPHLAAPRELEDARPLRFAQTLGLAFTLLALAGVAAGLPVLTLVATAAALSAAFLNAAFGICLGCELYLLMRRSLRPGSAPAPRTPSTLSEVSP